MIATLVIAIAFCNPHSLVQARQADNALMRGAANTTDDLQKAHEDLARWYSIFYNTLSTFYDAKPELICPHPEKLIKMLDDLNNQLQKVCHSEKLKTFKIIRLIFALFSTDSRMSFGERGTIGGFAKHFESNEPQCNNG